MAQRQTTPSCAAVILAQMECSRHLQLQSLASSTSQGACQVREKEKQLPAPCH